MKKLGWIIGLLAILCVAPSGQAFAQQIHIQINIGQQPAWGPVGYDYVRYYYFPELDVYFDVPAARFYYFYRGRWVASRYLPARYRHYDLYRTYKVVINTPEPWVYHRKHKRQFARYRNYRKQPVIRDSREARYRDSRRNDFRWTEEARPAPRTRPQSPATPRNPGDRNTPSRQPSDTRAPSRSNTPERKNTPVRSTRGSDNSREKSDRPERTQPGRR